MYYVNVYLIDRAYGGPEEGGWWYTYGEAIESISFHDKQVAEHVLQYKKLDVQRENSERRSDIGSVLSEGKFNVFLEEKPAESWPEEVPHYE